MNLEFILPIIWSIIIATGVIIYVVLDGFDLGVGILFPFISDEKQKNNMMNAIAPFWDGNETWLVLGGAGLFGAFPMVYSTILPILYIPLVIFLMALIFRGVSFEFRFKATHSRPIWDWTFAVGSTLMAICQGIVLGTFVQGFNMNGTTFIGSGFEWLSPFAIFCGIAVAVGYALLGASWLILKTSGDLQAKMRVYAKNLAYSIVLCMLIVAVWTPFVSKEILERWVSLPDSVIMFVIPLLIVYCIFKLFASIKDETVPDNKPFMYSIFIFVLCYLGLAASIWPYIIPRHIDIWQASSPVASQLFILVGTVIILPVILFYIYKIYSVFKGKITENDGY
jgi:cytochrome d ubiquinol oxidase subunit II